MSLPEQSFLLAEARKILTQNRIGDFTVPARKLYPFQWNWDSGFIALGYSHFEPDWAMAEMRSLFSAQWENGMLPHIVFHSEDEDSYFPNHDFWQANINPAAPLSPKTSGITQPPVHGFVLEKLWQKHSSQTNFLNFAKELFPKIKKLHEYFYLHRDPGQEGLAYIYHPWESGRDNSPIWDDPLESIDLQAASLPRYERKDTSQINPGERPSHQQYDQYVYLLELGKKHSYEGLEIFEESPFLIQDVMTNAILIRSNQALIRLGGELKEDVAQLEEWQFRAKKRFADKLWSAEHKNFLSFDLRAEQHLGAVEVGSWTALFAGVASPGQADRMNEELMKLHREGFFLCPSFDVRHASFDSRRYWRGPVWPQMNWMIYHGLKSYGFEDTARIMREDLLGLISKLGFFEYFEARKQVAEGLDKGYGGKHFSWTAACFMDLLLSP